MAKKQTYQRYKFSSLHNIRQLFTSLRAGRNFISQKITRLKINNIIIKLRIILELQIKK